MSSGWSSNPAQVLGLRDANRGNSILPPAHLIPNSHIPLPTHVEHGNENAPPLEQSSKVGKCNKVTPVPLPVIPAMYQLPQGLNAAASAPAPPKSRTKKRKSDTANDAEQPQAKAKGAKAPAAKKARTTKSQVPAELDVEHIELEDEDEGLVPMFDTCDTIRRKIRAILRKDGITQAAFLRAAGKCFPGGKNLQSKQLGDFLAKKGATSGNTSAIYYGSYVLFEKIRVKDGKPKTDTRLEMEEQYPGDIYTRPDGRPGMNTTDLRNYFICHVSEQIYEDQYGKTHVVKTGK